MTLHGVENSGTEHYVECVSVRSTDVNVTATVRHDMVPVHWVKGAFRVIEVFFNEHTTRVLHQTI